MLDKQWQELFGIIANGGTKKDFVPAMILSHFDHTSAGNPNKIHALMSKHAKNLNRNSPWSDRIAALKEAYNDFGEPDAGKMIEQWLIKNGYTP